MIGCEPLTPEQEKKFLDYFSKRRWAARNVAIMTFGIQTGFRISEILSLQRRDIMKGGKIVDRVYMRRYAMKGGKGDKRTGTTGRAMPLTERTKAALKAQLDFLAEQGYTDDNDYVFQTQREGNKPLNANGFWRALKDAKLALGITGKIATHSLRKTFAARIYDELLTIDNCDALRTLAKGMGHANINNTDKYLSFREDELIGAIQKVFGGSEPTEGDG